MVTRFPIWLPPRSTRAPKHPESLPLLIHHLPVRSVDCQLGCPGVWQKRLARTPNVPPGSVFVCRAALACASKAPLYAAIVGVVPVVSRSAPLGCNHAVAISPHVRSLRP